MTHLVNQLTLPRLSRHLSAFLAFTLLACSSGPSKVDTVDSQATREVGIAGESRRDITRDWRGPPSDVGDDGFVAHPCVGGFVDCNGNTADGCESNLNDPSNCGECGHSCQGSQCTYHLCTPTWLAFGQLNAYAIVVDDTYAFWTTSVTAGSILRAPKAGGAVVTLASWQADPGGLAQDATAIYWITAGDGKVVTMPKTGGTPTVLASGQKASRVAVDLTHVYWTEPQFGTVMRVAKTGGTPAALVTGEAAPLGIAVDDLGVYWTNDTASADVAMIAKTSGSRLVIGSGQVYPADIAVDATHAYWTRPKGGAVAKAPKGGGPVVLLAKGQTDPSAVAVDSSHVYWTCYGGGSVSRVSITGGPVLTLATGLTLPAGIALDAAYVYWTTLGDYSPANGTVERTPK